LVPDHFFTKVEAGEHSSFYFLDFVSIFWGSSIVGVNCAVGYKEILFIAACNGSEWVREEGKCDRLMASSVLEAFASTAVSLVVDLYCWCWFLEEAVDCVSDVAVHVVP
jgi:hypothetical protein